VDTDSFQVKPLLRVEPRDKFLLIVDTTTGLKEHVNVSIGKLSVLDQYLEAHHQLEHNFVLLEDTSIDVSVDLAG
jgi:hypothetical protein